MFKDLVKRYYKQFLCVVLICLVIEIIVFNFRHWESYTYAAPENPVFQVTGDIEQIDDAVYRVIGDSAEISITAINVPLKNLQLSCFDLWEAAATPGQSIDLRLSAADAASSALRVLPDTEVVAGLPESHYIRLHLTGNTTSIRIQLTHFRDGIFDLNGIKLNAVRPFVFHPLRFLGICIVGFLYLAFRRKSGLYQVALNWKNPLNKTAIIIVLLLNVLLIGMIGHTFRDENWRSTTWIANNQYDYLAQSIADGHVTLNFDPPGYLSEMENPYDAAARGALQQETGETYIIDFAYYNGHYYSYFGIVPVILFYLPYLLLTGDLLPTWAPVILCGLLFVCAAFWFWYSFSKKYFRKTSLGLYLLISSVFVAASEITYCVQVPTIYSLPIIVAVLFGMVGITFWIKASDGEGRILKRRLVFGAVFISLIIGCRPQLAVVLFLAIPIFWKDIKNRRFFSRKGIVNTLCVILPFIIVGIGLMYYNYIRFDSFLNFGATYNLTGFDMTHRGFIFDRFWLGFYEYFIQPLNIHAGFPYYATVVGQMGLSADYQGQIINEPLMGGFFAYNLIGLFAFGVLWFKKQLQKHGVWAFSLISLLLAVLLVAVDIQMVGMTLRYLTDFSALFMVAALAVILVLQDEFYEREGYKYFLFVVLLLAMLCVIVNYSSLMADGRDYSLRSSSPMMFYQLKYLFFAFR
ncbi:MAG: hypothetical protein IKD88_04330 [Lachnospiraceae bacterium]|nr:hypothetical protein [Lachnospiraceae bacterium]